MSKAPYISEVVVGLVDIISLTSISLTICYIEFFVANVLTDVNVINPICVANKITQNTKQIIPPKIDKTFFILLTLHYIKFTTIVNYSQFSACLIS